MQLPTTNSVWPISQFVDPDFQSKIPDLEVYELPNGLRVILLSDTNDRSSYIELKVNAGAVHQSSSLRGVAHYTEHMLFQGTQKFPTQKAFIDHAEEFNLTWNGYTSFDGQGFWVESDNDDESIDEAFIHICELIWEPLLPADKAEKERDVIFSERQAGLSDPNLFTQEVTNNHLYDADTAFAGGGIIGSDNDIQNFSHQVVVDFYQRYFRPSNMQLMVVGGRDKEFYRQKIQEYFVRGEKSLWEVNPMFGRKRSAKPKISEVAKDFNHVNLAMGVYLSEGADLSYPSPEFFALKFATHALSNRVFNELRDEKGLAYSVGCSLDNYDLGFYFNISGEFPKEKYKQARSEVDAYVEDKIFEPITQEEFRNALRYHKSTRWARSGRHVANYFSAQLFNHGQPMAPESSNHFLDQLTLEMVNETTNKLLKDRDLDTIIVGPI